MRQPKNRSKNKIKIWNHPKRIIYHIRLVCLRRPYNQPMHLYGATYWFCDSMMKAKHNIYKHFSGVSAISLSLLNQNKILKNDKNKMRICAKIPFLPEGDINLMVIEQLLG